MIDHKKSCDEQCASERGNAIGAVLVVLIMAAVGFFAYTSGKLDVFIKGGEVQTVSSEEGIDENGNPVLAEIYGEQIKRLDVVALINTMPPQMQQIPSDQLFQLALEQIINNKIIDDNAKSSGLEKDPEVVEQLEKVKTQIIRNKYLEDVIKSKLTDQRLLEQYDSYLANFPEVEEVKVAHILVESEKLAKSLIAKLNKGGSFADLAKENSTDGSADDGGNLGYFAKTDVVPEFAEAAFALKPGTYSKNPVKTDFGFHIIKVDEKRVRPPASLEEAKPYMKQELQRSILDETLKSLRQEVEIKRFDMNGNPIVQAEDTPEEVVAVEGEADAESEVSENPEVDSKPAEGAVE
ncbi:MAG: peptidylprolyl isomerase [Alphaproteobacteria bacterium]